MAAKKSKAVAKKEKAGLPANLMEELEEAGAKREAMGKDDMSIPFIQILQSLSPQCTKGEPEYVKEAEASMLYNTVTREMFPTFDEDDKPITAFRVISVAYKSSFIEWVTRANGGGFVAEYDVALGTTAITQTNDNNLDIIQQGSPIGTPGNQLSFTHTHFVFALDEDGSIEPAIMSMVMTQVKPSKIWNALIDRTRLPVEISPTKKKAPRFFGIWSVSTERRSNDHGTWYVWNFTRDGSITDLGESWGEVMADAKSFAAGINKGDVSADHAKAAAAENPSVDDGEGSDLDTEIPF